MIAPLSGHYKGTIKKKPWDYEVTVVIPHIETPELLETCVELYKLSKPEPYIIIVDTGSNNDTIQKVEKLRCKNVEVHYIRSHSYQHPSEPVALAMDLATLHCQTKWMLATHADCLLVKRDGVKDLIDISMERDNPCVGYQISPRDHWKIDGEPCTDWKWMAGHTFTLFDREVCDKLNLVWSLRRGSYEKNWNICESTNPALVPNVIDTEVFINYQLKEKIGKTPFLIGGEKNYVRNQNVHFDHIRSVPSAKLYASKSDKLRIDQEVWVNSALKDAELRLKDWET